MSGLQESYAGRIDFVLLDLDDSAQDGKRAELGFTAQAQYALVDADGAIVARWFGLLNDGDIRSELDALLQS